MPWLWERSKPPARLALAPSCTCVRRGLSHFSQNPPALLLTPETLLQDSETVYFEEGLKTAQKAVGEAMGKYNALLDSLSEQERGKLQRSMGMKMEQLKVTGCSLPGTPFVI